MNEQLNTSVKPVQLMSAIAKRGSDAALVAAITLLAISRSHAQEQVDIGSVDNEGFALIVDWFQSFVDFMAGPGGIAVVAISFVVAVATWMFAPREGFFGPVLRVVVGALLILNLATWISTLGFGG